MSDLTTVLRKCRLSSCVFIMSCSGLLFVCTVFLFGFMIIYNRNTTCITYEYRPESKFFIGGKNESYYYTYTNTHIEADLDQASFEKYAKSSGFEFYPIGNEGFDIRCFKFHTPHPSQEKSYINGARDSLWYIHHVTEGFYAIDDKDDATAKWTTVYDTENNRIIRDRMDKW